MRTTRSAVLLAAGIAALGAGCGGGSAQEEPAAPAARAKPPMTKAQYVAAGRAFERKILAAGTYHVGVAIKRAPQAGAGYRLSISR
jgi:hypothetical protein